MKELIIRKVKSGWRLEILSPKDIMFADTENGSFSKVIVVDEIDLDSEENSS